MSQFRCKQTDKKCKRGKCEEDGQEWQVNGVSEKMAQISVREISLYTVTTQKSVTKQHLHIY